MCYQAKRGKPMRLISLYLPDRYNCLSGLFFPFRKKNDSIEQDLSPVCLVGLNGSGKSNVIEALSEIFCLLDLSTKEYGPSKNIANFSFILEYVIGSGTTERSVKIEGIKDKVVRIFQLKQALDGSLESKWEEVQSSNVSDFLPKRVIGYSSGHNETISFPYLRSIAYYSEAVLKQASGKEIKATSPSTLFVDYDFNALMLIANCLFQPERLKPILGHLHLEGLRSFRIKVCFHLGGDNYVRRTDQLDEIVSKLESCALIKSGTPASPEGLILDFDASSVTQKRIKQHFGSAIEFFESLHRLYLLNPIKLEKTERDYYKRDARKGGLVPRPPSVPEREKIFSVSGVQVRLQPASEGGETKNIDYAGISDGEHQLVLIFAAMALFGEPESLFLLDEPESHFNPKWRSEFVQLVTSMFSAKSSDFYFPELVISTHSPFVVSGCKAKNVFKFSRQADSVEVKQVSEETYGASFDYLLSTLFDMDTLISSKAAEELRLILKDGSLEKLEAAKEDFGSSVEKAALFIRLKDVR
jgi:restriction system-associated AAA family ATPase